MPNSANIRGMEKYFYGSSSALRGPGCRGRGRIRKAFSGTQRWRPHFRRPGRVSKTVHSAPSRSFQRVSPLWASNEPKDSPLLAQRLVARGYEGYGSAQAMAALGLMIGEEAMRQDVDHYVAWKPDLPATSFGGCGPGRRCSDATKFIIPARMLRSAGPR